MNLIDMRGVLTEVLDQQRITTLFQPIAGVREASVFGYEALSRGPSDSPLHSPLALLRAADHFQLSAEVEQLCFETAVRSFVVLQLKGKLFVNLRPARLFETFFQPDHLLQVLNAAGLEPRSLVVEITENDPVLDYGALCQAVVALRKIGIEAAMDDLGEGFSSLRLWSELKPCYVKIDRHFINGLNQDPVKLQFVRSLQQIADNSQSRIVAEGVETPSELAVIKDLGIAFAQGYLIGRPAPVPSGLPSPEAMQCLSSASISVFPSVVNGRVGRPNASRLLVEAPHVSSGTPSEQVLDLMQQHGDLHALAVVDDGIPVGLITRPVLLDRFARVYAHELYGKKPCAVFMDRDTLVVDIGTLIADLSELVVRKGKQTFTDGFIITEGGSYRGLGSGYDLMREITEMQVVAARYANPLTLLPGNVPIHEHTDRLLAAGVGFVAAHCDLDAFKPYNDVYGYRKGDELIQMLARILSEECERDRDFLGHIGGDDFFILFQSHDWEARCQRILRRFDAERVALILPEHRAQGGYMGEDRRGRMVFHPPVSLSIGAVPVLGQGCYNQRQQVERAAADAKKMAKKADGSSLFIERRCSGPKPAAAAQSRSGENLAAVA